MKEKGSFYLYAGRTKVYVSEEVYRQYYKEVEHWRYIESKDRDETFVSFEALIEDGEVSELHQYISSFESTEDSVMKNFQLKKMNELIMELSQSEQEMISELFFLHTSERQYAKKIGVSAPTVKRKKEAILKKLKKNMGK